MINTPEFWVAISFLIGIGISYKLIFPTLKAGLVSHQGEIERLFSDAEAILKAAEKKFSLTQERFDALPNLLVEMEKEFDFKVNQLLQGWTIQQEKIMTRYHHLLEHKLQYLKDHAKSQNYACLSDVSLNALQVYIHQQMNAKKHQYIVLEALKNL